MSKDAIVGLVCLVGSVVLYSTLGHIDEERAVIFPQTIIIIMMVLSALLLVQGMLVKRGSASEGPKYPWLRFFSLFGIIVLYLAVSESLGFYLSAFIFFVVVTFIFGRSDLSPKKALMRTLSSAAFCVVLFVLFSKILEVQTPKGFLF